MAKGAATAFALAALAYVISHPTRNAGKALDEQLWPKWGGAPSVTFLRHRDPTIDPISKARYHASLVNLKAVPFLPSPAEEAASPLTADPAYEAASIWLRGKTRDRKSFPLVFEENVHYGYLRNLLACRGWGIAGCALGLASALIAFLAGREPIVETLFTVLVTLYIGLYVREGALRRQAGTYARRSIEAIDLLGKQPATTPAKEAKAASSRSATRAQTRS